ncbi:hypothetical protein [Streptomyces sp. NPDC021622]|uniref:hypothetical protein n=1 Tax=Streptomyces sp. NPDC021622 TaxID=3155013 RepID=UPI0033FCD94F
MSRVLAELDHLPIPERHGRRSSGPSYDHGECVWQEPAQLLFQRRICGEDRAFTEVGLHGSFWRLPG